MHFSPEKNINAAFGKKIEAVDLKEHEDRLNREIMEISFFYAEQKHKQMSAKDPSYKISRALKKFTPIREVVLRQLFEVSGLGLEGTDFGEKKEKLNFFLGRFFSEADRLFDEKGPVFNELPVVLDNIMAEIRAFQCNTEKSCDEEKDDNKITKLISFGVVSSKNGLSDSYRELKNEGFSEQDYFLEIHLDSFYASGLKDLTLDAVKEDFAAIAEHVFGKQPEIKAVIGNSWLLDTPLAERFGFHKIKTRKKENSFSTWLQFVDKDGQISKKRLEKFLQSGEFPYNSVSAYMSKDDFLSKYSSWQKERQESQEGA